MSEAKVYTYEELCKMTTDEMIKLDPINDRIFRMGVLQEVIEFLDDDRYFRVPLHKKIRNKKDNFIDFLILKLTKLKTKQN